LNYASTEMPKYYNKIGTKKKKLLKFSKKKIISVP